MYPDQNGAYAADWWPLFWTRLKELQGQFTDKTDVRVLVLATYTVRNLRKLAFLIWQIVAGTAPYTASTLAMLTLSDYLLSRGEVELLFDRWSLWTGLKLLTKRVFLVDILH